MLLFLVNAYIKNHTKEVKEESHLVITPMLEKIVWPTSTGLSWPDLKVEL